jgi:FkbM family methyltransferase
LVGTRHPAAGSDTQDRQKIGAFTAWLGRRLLRQELSDPGSGLFMVTRVAFERAMRRLSNEGYSLLIDLIASSPRTLRLIEVPYHPRVPRFRESNPEPEVLWQYVLLIIDKLVGRWIPPRLILFSLVGATGVTVHYLQVATLIGVMAIPFRWAQLVSTVLVMAYNFILNNALTYRDHRLKGLAFLRGMIVFYLVCGIGLIGNVGVSSVIYEDRYAWWLAAGAGIAIGTAWNYVASKYFAWRVDAEFVYTRLLRPKPLRAMANAFLRAITPVDIVRDGTVLVLNPTDPVISGALVFGVYENAELDFVRQVVKPGMTVLDIGANIGVYTAVCGKAVGAAGRVISVEPDPENLIYLRRTIQANGLGDVLVVPGAASDYDGTASLFTSSENRGDNRMYANEMSDGATPVPVVHLDRLLREIGVNELDFIKIDVQGYESAVLNGLIHVIRQSRNVTLISEFWPQGIRAAGADPERFLETLIGLGFALYELRGKREMVGLHDPKQLIVRLHGRRYTNIVGFRGASPFEMSVVDTEVGTDRPLE